jgi:chorismate mutase/prephenate dehydratase|tara:strand:+ start:2265 stop:3350 length:1086 start_codon:yes stop_codon:yes gene_type:complete
MSEKQALQAIRQKIDDIDLQVQVLLNQRANMAQEVANIKIANGEQTDFYRPDREAMVLRQVMERNQGPLDSQEMARLFREIMSACLAAEKPLQVAYLGPEGSFTQGATLKQFGGSIAPKPMSTISDVFNAVEQGNANYGVVPVENSTEGMVSHTLDRFITTPLKINGEISLRIHHYLLSKETSLSDVVKIYSHPQALAQCRQWLANHCPDCELIAVNSNSKAAEMVASERGSAAIAANKAAEIYYLVTLASNIEDEVDNTTRFLVIGRQDISPSGHDKTALLVSTKNEPGALNTILEPLAKSGITMTRIESRPSRQGVWEYVFFIDIEGHREDSNIAKALAELKEASSMFKVLGSYPKAVL